MESNGNLLNFIDSQWRSSAAADYLDVLNPTTNELLGQVPLSPGSEVDQAVRAATRAFEGWRRTPATDRIQYLFQLKSLLEEHFEDIAQTISMECGKTIGESRGKMRRAIKNVEVACGIPTLIQGDFPKISPRASTN